jgi:hypothetical protein
MIDIAVTTPSGDLYGDVSLYRHEGSDEWWSIHYGPRDEVLARMDALVAVFLAARAEVEQWPR